MSEIIDQLVDRAKKHLTGEPLVDEFVKELELLPFEDGGGYQGGPGSLLRDVSIQAVENKLNVRRLYDEWARVREAQLAKAVRQRYLDSTYEVTYAKGNRWGKPERIPREDADKPWKPGMLLLDEKGRIEGRGFDDDFGPSFSLKSLPIGHEMSAGVVKAKRQIRTDQGLQVQYLIKPWSASGKKKYEAQKRLSWLERSLRVDRDMMSEEDAAKVHQEIDSLRKKFRL